MGNFEKFLLNESKNGKISSADIFEFLQMSEDIFEFKNEDYANEWYEEFTIQMFDGMFGEGSAQLAYNGNEKMDNLREKMLAMLPVAEYGKEKVALQKKYAKISADALNKFAAENKDTIIRAKKLD
jgi:hypothetical protein